MVHSILFTNHTLSTQKSTTVDEDERLRQQASDHELREAWLGVALPRAEKSPPADGKRAAGRAPNVRQGGGAMTPKVFSHARMYRCAACI